ncbi:similar to Saccharomyces cerevisiae YKL186C MTR2 mRNA transport regulator, essential nuclear protein [Maudiozyma barnettii]|uniref:Similar to Saccharomyces cerevisiae YKL186C MTR2 mRNA transport regulator, essential nuclear protein n=1 Tax=Maudiozyma barnettii TaxID=61262 RepID=A0A8H2VKB7_9SACH|nr:Mtr2p [Kazachstania barnettii]CAB4256992.1 similar to Saccharomyces cerevisiae YKL186C MTR2 mRNA transport regulator, essential nuclear protein [Kazachstania barnettii]CAD1779363.1 similar to Saccharomyces cerevisiae YKL186C MTR2 mRNA transport regulator, essential nuclear protein [Kazachstania barnettii]
MNNTFNNNNTGNGNDMNTKQQPHITETFIQKIFAHLDNQDVSKLNNFLQLFSNNSNGKIIINGQRSNDAMSFLTLWSQQIVSTQHSITSIDYHLIPGSGTVLCNIGAKVRFDESGRDKNGQDAVIRNNQNQNQNQLNQNRNRQFWGSYFGVSLQLILDDRIYRNDLNGVINSFNYTIINKPDDSLIEL